MIRNTFFLSLRERAKKNTLKLQLAKMKTKTIFVLFTNACSREGLHYVVSHKSILWQSGNMTAKAVKLGTVRGLVASARKGFMK